MDQYPLPELQANTIAVGFDVHKYTHTGVAIDIFGKELDSLEFSNQNLDLATTWLTKFKQAAPLIVGIEDVHGYGCHLAKALVNQGFVVRFSPAKLTDSERHHSNRKDKTDHLDAKRVAEVIVHKMDETLPADPILSDDQVHLRSLDLLIQERGNLVKDQTELKNQLHTLLHQYYGDRYRQEYPNIFSLKAIASYTKDLSHSTRELSPSRTFIGEDVTYLKAAILRRFSRLTLMKQQIKELNQLIDQLSQRVPETKKLKDNLVGCGSLTAAKIMVEIKTIKRFNSASKLARYGGFAPITYHSAKSGRCCADMGGNRRLNQAVHVIALSQIGARKLALSVNYFNKKTKEGKTKMWAIRCLKRQLINRIYNLLRY